LKKLPERGRAGEERRLARTGEGNGLDRREVVAALLAGRGDLLVVAGLGGTAWDVTAAGDDDRTFPLWGAMGGAVAFGLGLALARPDDRVLVVTGDGEALMGLGALATAGRQRPANLGVAVVDNGRYGETGRQATHTACPLADGGTDLAAAALACGWRASATVRAASEVAAGVALVRSDPGPVLVVFEVGDGPAPLVMPPRDGAHLKERFRQAVLGQP
jgi:thiamine pyrophosphate-dependent acetolactate synthase large subunit-like protein